MVKDRGNMKWGNAFMQPEHLNMLNKMYKEQDYKEKPILDDQQLFEINALIHIALKDDLTVKIEYFRDKKVHKLKGKIIFIQSQKGYLKLTDSDQTEISFEDIVNVTIL